MGITQRLKAAYRALTRDSFPTELLEVPSAAGVTVTQDSALQVSAYWNGLNVLSGDIGVLDRMVYRRTGDGDDRERATGHYLYRLMHDAPNDYTVPQVFWQTLTFHAASWGNGYAEIEWDNALRPIALHIITPDCIEPYTETVRLNTGAKVSRLYYLYRGTTRLEAEDLIHVPGLAFDGIRGYSVVRVARQSLGLTMAAERFGASFFGEGAWPGIVLEHPEELSDGAHKRLRESFNAMHKGPDKAHRVLIAEEGMKASRQGLTIPPEDAQFLESRSFQVEEIARWLNMPPHKLKHKMGERPGGNLEAAEIEYHTGTLLPWTKRIEQECNRKLIPAGQRKVYFVEHLFESRLRADIATRVDAEQKWIEMGVLTPEYVAKLENFPAPPKKADPPPPAPPEPAPSQGPPPSPAPPAEDGERQRARADVSRLGVALDAQRELVLERCAQYVRREALRAKQAAKKPEEFAAWVEDSYGRETAVLADMLQPLVRFVLAVFGSDADPKVRATVIAAAHTARSREELLSLGIKDLAMGAGRLAQRWELTRAAELTESVMAAASTEGEEENEHVA